MKLRHILRTTSTACVLATSAAFCIPAGAVNLTVTHWADGMFGAPFTVALEKGYFKEAGVDVTGFLTSAGGGTTVRNAMASEIPYGEVALPAAIAAIKQGVDLTIVHAGVISLADIYWVAKADSPLNSIADLSGKKLGYSSPKSVTDMVSTLALNKAGLLDKVERRSVGSLSGALTALRQDAVDVVYNTEPAYTREKSTLKMVFRSTDLLPNTTQTVGVVRTEYLKKNPDVIKAIIAARRKGVEFIQSNPGEAGEILARQYKLPVDIAKTAIANILAAKGTYWSTGKFDYDGMKTMLTGLQLVKAIEPGPFDWDKIVDESLMQPDQRK
ncbi:MAG: NitT/TauT family transport system substrate-binding protein [Burkholderiaceae bacterium]|jgi:NitT/TauT family transport system substrate-binding protein